MKDTILQLLVQPNITQAEVAKVLNVSEGYVSQVVNTPEFQNELAERRVASLKKETAHDDNLARIEETALSRVDNLIPYITKPAEAAKVFQILNNAKRRGATAEQQQSVIHNHNTVVLLQLPDTVKQKFKVNPNNEVVQVDDRPMATMPSGTLLAQAKLLATPEVPTLERNYHDSSTSTDTKAS